MSAMPLTTALSFATSNGAGHRIACVPASGSGATSVTTTRRPRSARSIAVAVPMPRLPPVIRTIPSAVTAVALIRCEQPTRDQLPVGGDDVIGHGSDFAASVGVAPAEIAARAHQHMDDGFELRVAEIHNRAGV